MTNNRPFDGTYAVRGAVWPEPSRLLVIPYVVDARVIHSGDIGGRGSDLPKFAPAFGDEHCGWGNPSAIEQGSETGGGMSQPGARLTADVTAYFSRFGWFSEPAALSAP